VADELQAARLAIVGVSLGGLVAGHYAALRPERVAAQTLVAPAGLSAELTPFLRWLARPIIGHLLAAPPKGLLRRGLQAMVRQPRAVPEEFVDVYHRYRHTAGAASALVHIMRQGTTKGQLRPEALLGLRLQDCSVPTLLVLGREDPLVPHRHGEALLAAMPHTSLWLVPDCGHWPHREHPEAFSERLVAFLQEHYPAGR
jgi:pimeloyl-ACP methyl ester carboxylesterase